MDTFDNIEMETEEKVVKEIHADTNTPFLMIELADAYIRLGIVYVIFALGAIAMYALIIRAPLLIMMMLIAVGGAIYYFYNNKKLEKKQQSLDNCYIRLTDSDRFLECRQLVDGKYEYMKISLAEIKELMEVDEGIQLWLEQGADTYLFLVDDEPVKRSIVCLNCFAYDIDEFIDWYVTFSSYLPVDVEAHRYGQTWSHPTKNDETVKMMIPCVLFIIPLIISIVLGFI